MRRGNFYGDGNDVDIAQRHAPATLSNAGDDGTENVVKAAMSARPKATNNDGVKGKRLEDEIRGAMAGIDTSPDEEALLRQENIPSNRTNAPVPDEYSDQAERITRSLESSDEFKYSGQFADPEKRSEFVEQLAMELSGKKPMPKPAQQEPEERPFSSNEFWSDRKQQEQAAKQVRPRRL